MNFQCLLILVCLVATSIAYSTPKEHPSEIFGGKVEHEKKKADGESKAKFPQSPDSHEVAKRTEFFPAFTGHEEVGVRSIYDVQRKLHNKKFEKGIGSHDPEASASENRREYSDRGSRSSSKEDSEKQKNKDNKGEDKLASDRLFGTGVIPEFSTQPPNWRNEYDYGLNRNAFVGPEYGRPSYLYPPIDGRPDLFSPGIDYNRGVLGRDGYGGYGTGYNRDGYGGYGYNRDGYGGYGTGYNRDGYGGYGYNRDGYGGYGYNRDGYGTGYNRDGYGIGYNGVLPNRGIYDIGYNRGVLGRDGYGYRLPLDDGILSRNPGIYGLYPGRDTGYGLYPDDRNGIYGTWPYRNYSDTGSSSFYGRGRDYLGRDLYGYGSDSLRPNWSNSYGSGSYAGLGSQSRPEVKTETNSKREISPSEEVKITQEVDPLFYG